jgi:thiol-disulfide isomerase/thioredoxin
MMASIKRLLTSLLLLLISLTSHMSFAQDQFTLVDMNGVTHQLASYKGKWVIVNYWATWCPPCLEEIPDLVNLYDSRKGIDLMVIGVVFDYETLQEVETYVDDMLMSYPIVLGNEDVVKQIGAAEVLPTSYIYNPQGKLVKVKRGIVSRQYLETIIR